ncbi:MAG TPA: hypothetical protein VH988_23125 [Thermoanaerobaculia bacterium]|jgi:tetratricopeptide (TPR) repeat protein|nr:hypothetical protein [Thermoanaerobaculia bacterium]
MKKGILAIKVLDRLRPTIREGRFADVCQLLESEIESALARRRRFDAAVLSSVLGSFLAVMGKIQEGLSAHLRAESIDPAEPQHAIAIARYLLDILGDVESAYGKVEELSRRKIKDPKALYDMATIRGICATRSGLIPEGVLQLDASLEMATKGNLPTVSWSLELVEELSAHTAAVTACQSYLDEALRRSEEEGDSISAERSREILKELRGAH